MIARTAAICEGQGSVSEELADGWSAADEAAARAILSAIAEGDGVNSPTRDEIPPLFRTTEPALERRFAFNLHTGSTAYLGFEREVAAGLAGAARQRHGVTPLSMRSAQQ